MTDPERTEGPKPARAVSLGFLQWLPPVAVFAVVSVLASRALLPGLRGSVVGISSLIDAADSTLGILTQMTAILLLATALILTTQVVRSRAPLALKLLNVFFVGLGFFGTFAAMIISRAPTFVMASTCFAQSGLAIVMGLYAFRREEVGFIAFAPVLVGTASLIRMIGAVVSDTAAEVGADLESIVGAFHFATVLATVSFALALAAVIVVWAWLIQRSRKAGAGIVGALVVACVAGALLAAAPADDLDTIVVVVVRRGVNALLTRPAPLVPAAGPMLLVIGAPLTALAVLICRRAPAELAAAVALTVLAGDAADIPILGLTLACGAVGLGAYAVDPRGVALLLARAETARSGDAAPVKAPEEASLPRSAT